MILAAQNSFGAFMAGASLFGGLMFSIYPLAVARTHDMFESKAVVTVKFGIVVVLWYWCCDQSHGLSCCHLIPGQPIGPRGSSFFSITSAISEAVSFFLRQKEIVQIIPVENHR
jgi:hypothetical protein